MKYEVENGVMYYELQDTFEYMMKGETTTAKTLKLLEPTKAFSFDAIRLGKLLRKGSIQAVSTMKDLFPDNALEEKKDVAGEEIIPFYKQPKPDEKKIDEEARELVDLLMSSDLDMEDVCKVGRKLLTKKSQVGNTSRLGFVDDTHNTKMTPEMFDSMSVSDQLGVIAFYATFFDIKSCGVLKAISNSEQES